MQNEFLKKQNIVIKDAVTNWKEAISLCVKPLVDNGYVSSRYTEAIFHNIESCGTGFAVLPYIILPHAKPEQGVFQNSMSVLMTKKPFYFEDKCTPVKLVIVLAPISSRCHLQMLKTISTILCDEEKTRRILESKSEEELFHLLVNYEEQTEKIAR